VLVNVPIIIVPLVAKLLIKGVRDWNISFFFLMFQSGLVVPLYLPAIVTKAFKFKKITITKKYNKTQNNHKKDKTKLNSSFGGAVGSTCQTNQRPLFK
jgi:hypothetical protein